MRGFGGVNLQWDRAGVVPLPAAWLLSLELHSGVPMGTSHLFTSSPCPFGYHSSHRPSAADIALAG